MPTRYHCGQRERRDLVDASDLSGIDFVEVLDTEAPQESRQKLLLLRLLQPLPEPDTLGTENFVIEGGARITGIRVLWAVRLVDVTDTEPAAADDDERTLLETWLAGAPDRDHYLVLRVDAEGDYSPYTLRLVRGLDDPAPPEDFDVRLAEVTLFFKVECPSDFDCKTDTECPPEVFDEPRIDYLAKDYRSFRRLLLDRLSVLAPEWRERSPADLGIALVELLAYTGDQLSYLQDAVATEAYLHTARRRISVRRHARLVDYFVHEGSNARAWVQLQVSAPLTLPGPETDGRTHGVRLATRPEIGRMDTVVDEEQVPDLLQGGAEIFETLHAVELRSEWAKLHLYTWSDRECCLPVGATSATLRRELPEGGLLSDEGIDALPGTFLLFEEIVGPQTGTEADADPAHRQVVRVLTASKGTDLLDDTPIVEITWHPRDALTFPVCVSAQTDDTHGARFVDPVSVVRGNLVLADHGLTLEAEDLGTVPEDVERFQPVLSEGPLTHAVPLPERFRPVGPAALGEIPTPASAASARDVEPARAEPAVRLEAEGFVWRPRRDLLASQPFHLHFVTEMDDRRRAHLRFGDDVHGQRPNEGVAFTARYRVGHGPAGNFGPGALTHILGESALDVGAVTTVRNPLAAFGGRVPETVDEVRRDAPEAFRVQQRAVTEEDYARAAERHPEVQRAAATFRWTGSWHTVFVTVDRRGGRPVDAAFEDDLRRHLELFRLAGHDLEVDAPRFVPLHLELHVCVKDGHRRSDVHRELLRVLSDAELPGGRRGFFHPDLWTFGRPFHLSRLVAVAARVDGVASVEVRRFSRWREDERPEEREDQVMTFGRLEIPRLDNDPSFQENGLLEIELGGGL